MELSTADARPVHAQYLADRIAFELEEAAQRRHQRIGPRLPADIPIALGVDSGADVDFLRTAFGFEVLADKGGQVLSVISDPSLSKLSATLEKYRENRRGGGSAAKVHDVSDTNERLQALLDSDLLELWPNLQDGDMLILDLAVACGGQRVGRQYPGRREDWDDIRWAKALALAERSWEEAYRDWDELKFQRAGELLSLVTFHGGQLLSTTEAEASGIHELPDSVQMRIQVSGAGLRDIVLNYPYLFEVCLPEGIEQHVAYLGTVEPEEDLVQEPSQFAPTVCIMDSGVQEGHRLLSTIVRTELSQCFLPSRSETDVADYCASGGHGTRVAGAVAWHNDPGAGRPACWIANARILDERNELAESCYPPLLVRRVVEQYVSQGVKIFVHAVNSTSTKRRAHMPAWAAEFDYLSSIHDLLVIQSAGNIPISSANPPGVQEHLRSGRAYPSYLLERSARIANPGFAMHSVTVGSLASASLESGEWRTIAPTGAASAFSRSGPGMWDATKPDIVEFAGDYCVAGQGEQLRVGIPGVLSSAYPKLVRSTYSAPGPSVDADTVGTSFSAPLAAHVAARIAEELPNEPALAYRALLVHSARWPQEATADEDGLGHEELLSRRMCTLRTLGFGVPDVARATQSTEQRTTLFTPGDNRIHPREAHVYQVSLPSELLAISSGCRVLVEITLAYAAKPRRTRRGRQYMATWADWQSSKRNESLDSFLSRVLKEPGSSPDGGRLFDWMLGGHNTGQIDEARRNLGSVQKDWAIVDGEELPEQFAIAVVGHPGWDGRPDNSIPYCLCVTIELLDSSVGPIDLYTNLELSVNALRASVSVTTS